MDVPKKVLVVDNDEVVLVLISHILTRQSYVVHATGDIPEADRLMKQNDYDAILLDLKMPQGGVDYLRRLESANPALLGKIIVVTGAIHEIPSVRTLPVHSVVRKPFEVTELIDTVRKCVSQ